MTFHYTDPDGDRLQATVGSRGKDPVLALAIVGYPSTNARVDIPLDRVEELVAGIRDTARQAATQT